MYTYSSKFLSWKKKCLKKFVFVGSVVYFHFGCVCVFTHSSNPLRVLEYTSRCYPLAAGSQKAVWYQLCLFLWLCRVSRWAVVVGELTLGSCHNDNRLVFPIYGNDWLAKLIFCTQWEGKSPVLSMCKVSMVTSWNTAITLSWKTTLFCCASHIIETLVVSFPSQPGNEELKLMAIFSASSFSKQWLSFKGEEIASFTHGSVVWLEWPTVLASEGLSLLEVVKSWMITCLPSEHGQWQTCIRWEQLTETNKMVFKL